MVRVNFANILLSFFLLSIDDDMTHEEAALFR